MNGKVGGAALAALGAAALAVPAGALAHKHPSPSGRHSISMIVSENPVTYGDALTIYGRLVGAHDGGRTVTLWHRLEGRGRPFTIVQRTTTDAAGFYAFSRLAEVVDSNRDWYVTSLGARSRTIREKVVDVVTLNGPPDGTQLVTGKPATSFTGSVSPADVGQEVLLQRQNAATGTTNWNTIQKGVVGPGGNFTFNHIFVVPGDANIRAEVRGNLQHLASPSPQLNYEISQAQKPGITIESSQDPIQYGGSVTISGTVANGAGDTVTLLAHIAGQPFTTVTTSTVNPTGGYQFPTMMPTRNTYYEVKATPAVTPLNTPSTVTADFLLSGRHHKRTSTPQSPSGPSGPSGTSGPSSTPNQPAGTLTSAILFEGVRDVLTASASPTTISQGQTVTFSGTVAPDHSGHAIWLQEENAAGTGFHTVQVADILPGSTYQIIHQIFAVGTRNYRVQMPGGPENEGAVSQTFPITVNPVVASALPQTQPVPQSQGQ